MATRNIVQDRMAARTMGVAEVGHRKHSEHGAGRMRIPTKARFFWPLLLVLFLTDCATKNLVVETMTTASAPRPIFDSFVRVTLAHNSGTAFGLDLRPYVGNWARPIMIALMLAMLGVLAQLYRRMSTRSRLAVAALGLTCGGALGNLYDRVRFPLGVVDFIDVGVGMHRFYVFNVADAGITGGAVLLGIVMLRESREQVGPRSAA
jgi:signal peptidase II